MLGHKPIFKEFRKFVITSSNFSDHTRVKLKINYKKKNGKHIKAKYTRLNKMLLNSQWRNQKENQMTEMKVEDT